MNPTPTTHVYLTCPSCRERNLWGDDLCWNCQQSLTDLELPTHADSLKESDTELNRPLGALHLRPATLVKASDTVSEALVSLRGDSGGAVLVMNGDEIAGIFTERDVLMKVAGIPGAMNCAVADVMTPDPVTLSPTDHMNVVLNKMGVGGFRHIPVVQDGEVAGIVTASEAMRWVLLQYFG